MKLNLILAVAFAAALSLLAQRATAAAKVSSQAGISANVVSLANDPVVTNANNGNGNDKDKDKDKDKKSKKNDPKDTAPTDGNAGKGNDNKNK